MFPETATSSRLHQPTDPLGLEVCDRGDSQTLQSEALLNGQSCVTIEHEGTLYTLRATRSGKLILTK